MKLYTDNEGTKLIRTKQGLFVWTKSTIEYDVTENSKVSKNHEVEVGEGLEKTEREGVFFVPNTVEIKWIK